MDYDKVYRKFVKHWKQTTPKDRLYKRNKSDERLLGDKLYVENHHIVPSSVGGSDSVENLVLLLPEEHLLAHKLRYKAYNMRQDMLAVRYILNGLSSKGHISSVTKLRLSKHLLKTYAWIRQNSSDFRLNHGWQTTDGVKRISESRKGTMPVKDAVTGEIIGSIATDHPKVISKEWVHHTTGRKLSQEHKDKLPSQKGQKNTNFKDFATREFLLELANIHQHTIFVDGFFKSRRYEELLKNIVREKFNKKISIVTIKNRFGNIENFVNEYNSRYGTEYRYEPYHRSETQKSKISNTSSEFIWITNGVQTLRQNKTENIPEGWKQGRTIYAKN